MAPEISTKRAPHSDPHRQHRVSRNGEYTKTSSGNNRTPHWEGREGGGGGREGERERDYIAKKRVNLKVDNIVELLKFVLETMYFRFLGEIYHQKFNVATGSPVSPIVFNMEDIEQ